MKSGRDYSWWVSYSWEYEYFDSEENDWLKYDDFDSRRFDCLKKDIKKTVTEHIKKYELQGEEYRNLKVHIHDFYMTTTEEV